MHALPVDLSERLVELLRTLGLHYGCIDLRQTPEGEYVFFEVNPSGQFLFAEIDTGQPLLRVMAELLYDPSRIAPITDTRVNWNGAEFADPTTCARLA